MQANVWAGKNRVEIRDVPEPQIVDPKDAIVEVTTAAICGSDLHLVQGFVPSMKNGDILGHEFMGRVVEVGSEVKNVAVGDRVVVPFAISCGTCWMCRNGFPASCENSNPNSWMAESVYGHATAGMYGYSRLTGGFAGGHAEYVRVPFADVNPLKVPDKLTDEQALFLGDILPTGWMGAEMCDIEPGDVVAVWGAGPVGQFAMLSARIQGAARVIGIDRYDYRLAKARDRGVETINYEQQDVLDTLRELTGGRGPDKVIDAVGMEAHSPRPDYALDRAKQMTRIETDRPLALREAIMAVRNGGIVSVIGAYGGFVDMFPIGSVMNRGLTIRAGQCHVQRYMQPLLERVESGEIDPTFVITHRLPLAEAPRGFDMFKNKLDGCEKVLLTM